MSSSKPTHKRLKIMTNKLNRLRDDIACAIANFALNYIATPRYRDLIDGAIRLGIETAREETK